MSKIIKYNENYNNDCILVLKIGQTLLKGVYFVNLDWKNDL